MISFIVAGRPLPQPKPRTRGKARFYPKPYLECRDRITDAAQIAAAELEDRGTPWDAHRDSYRVVLRFFQPDKRRTDIDRLCATALDALTRAGLWGDDRLVSSLRADRALDPERARLEIEVEVLRD